MNKVAPDSVFSEIKMKKKRKLHKDTARQLSRLSVQVIAASETEVKI